MTSSPPASGASANYPARTPATGKAICARIENRRAFFRAHGATATDHGHPTAQTADLSPGEAEELFARVTARQIRAQATANCSAPRC